MVSTYNSIDYQHCYIHVHGLVLQVGRSSETYIGERGSKMSFFEAQTGSLELVIVVH
jgi:hypothetical protein